MIRLELGGFEVEVWTRPSTTMPPARQDELLPDFWTVGLDGFAGMEPFATDDIVKAHCLGGDVVSYVFDGGRCRALFGLDLLALPSGAMAYFSNAAIHSSLRGRGLYPRTILLRLALMHATGAQWWSARTQNPLVAQAYRRLGAYPFDGADADTLAVAGEMAAMLFARYTDGPPQPGQELDVATGVLRRAYPLFVYDRLPDGGDEVVTAHFARHLNHEDGDALLLTGRVDDAVSVMAGRSQELSGTSFEDLVQRIAPAAASV